MRGVVLRIGTNRSVGQVAVQLDRQPFSDGPPDGEIHRVPRVGFEARMSRTPAEAWEVALASLRRIREAAIREREMAEAAIVEAESMARGEGQPQLGG